MIAWYCLQTFPLIYPWFWIVLIAVGKLHKTFTKWLTKDCDGHFRSFRELLRSWTTTWWLFWWLGSPYLGTFSAPRHHGPHAHRENLRVCQCLSSFFIIQIAFVFHTCIVNVYVNITNSWFMQCLGGCFLCVSSHSNGEFSLKHTHTHFWSVPAPRLWLMISTSFFLKRSLSTAHCISKNRGYLEEAGALRYQRMSKGNSKILSIVDLFCLCHLGWRSWSSLLLFFRLRPPTKSMENNGKKQQR